ncbi:MAG TPA: helix-turn-helix transcriptional regulator [Bacteroidia bacterium]|nr:helix-turn-helix transcriptional regulator [Bacteroidia bacterium]
MNNEKKVCREIGIKLKDLRLKNGYSSYENFAVEHDLSRMQYWRIEKGLTNLTIRSLIKILNIHKITVEDFFLGLLIQQMDGKALKGGDGAKFYKKDGHRK